MDHDDHGDVGGSESSPFSLYRNYKKRSSNDGNGDSNLENDDAESLLQNVLSSLSTLQQKHASTAADDRLTLDWMWQMMTVTQNDDEDDNEKEADSAEKIQYNRQWWYGLRLIHSLLPQISSPFEIHSVASQAMIFSDYDYSSSSSSSASQQQQQQQQHYYCTLCLLLCVYALQQCPSSSQLYRWKRWQSILCEMIRIFQDSFFLFLMMGDSQSAMDDDCDAAADEELTSSSSTNKTTATKTTTTALAIPLWVQFVVPACRHVVDQLPWDEALVVAIFAGLVGTTSHLAVQECQRRLTAETTIGLFDGDDPSKVLLDPLYQTILFIVTTKRIDDRIVWLNPWRRQLRTSRAASTTNECSEIQTEDVEFFMSRDYLQWWTTKKDRPDERVAYMNTGWNDLGISLLATLAFVRRPLVYHPNCVWSMWLPHVVLMLKRLSECPTISEERILVFLQDLLACIPELSLSTDNSHGWPLPSLSSSSSLHPNCDRFFERPDSPLETFQLLSFRMMTDRKPGFNNDDAYRRRSERIAGLMKILLNRYTMSSQVRIVKRLVQDCATPGLKGRYMDLLRPVVVSSTSDSDPNARDELWNWLSPIIVTDMMQHSDQQHGSLADVEGLIENTEVYVGAIAMMQLWWMVRKDRQTPAEESDVVHASLASFLKTLQHNIAAWSDTAPGEAPPAEFHRVFLMELAISNALDAFSRDSKG